nr:helix-turn-helix domain-containing protein [Polynucleobacter sp. MWH-Post4-6-1]
MVNKTPVITQVNGRAFQEARERLGISVKDLAKQSCFSVRQIEQIENGKSDAFYSLAIKANAAKKIAHLLKLSEAEAFEFKVDSLTLAAEKETLTTDTDNSQSSLTSSPATTPARSIATHTDAVDSRFSSHSSALSEQLEPRFGPDQDGTGSLASLNHKPRSGRTLIISLALAAIVLLVVLIQSDLLIQIQNPFSPKPAPVVEVMIPEDKPAEPEKLGMTSDNNASTASPAATLNTNAATGTVGSNSAPSTALATVAPSAAITPSNTLEGCPSVGVSASAYTPTQSNRSADMVYVVSKVNQTVCVVDANGKIQNRSLDAGTSASFYGKPPFKVMTSGLSQVDLFFQGWKVRPTNPNEKTIELLPLINATPPAPSVAPAPAGNSPSTTN